MPLVVDTSVALPATLSPNSHPRKLFVMLAFGALAYRAEHLQADIDALQELAAAEGGEIHGLATLEATAEQARRRHAAMAELLPYGAPDDWCAVGFSALFDEFGRKLREAGPRLDPTIREEDIAPLRRQFEWLCVTGPAPFDLTDVPTLTRDPTDDPIVYASDNDILPDGDEHDYAYGEHHVRAVRFGHFVNDCFAEGFRWSAVDAAWLSHAFASSG